MATSKLKQIIEAKENLDVNEAVIELQKKYPSLRASISTFSMLEDAKKKKAKIYKIEEPIKNELEVPKLVLL